MAGRLFVSMFALAAAAPCIATAQSSDIGADVSLFDRARSVSVRERPRPDFDALGIRRGAFLIYPKLEASVAYEDNVFAAETNEESDTVTSLSPSISAVSQWSRHDLQLYARGNAYQYADFSSQNEETYSVGANGRLDVVRGTFLRGGVGYDHLVEPRSSASSPDNAEDPIRYEQTSLDLGASREFNRLRLRADFRYRDYQFENTRDFFGAVIDQSFRDNQSYEYTLRGDYALSPALAVYGTVTGNEWAFANPTTPGDVSRDATGFNAAAGADFEITRLMRGQVQVGYLEQKFDDPRVGDIDGLSLLARVEYFPTELITVTFNAERSAQATGVIGAGGVLRTSFGAQVDYELLRNLIISAKAQRMDEEYQGFDRDDDVWTAMVGAYYLINRRVGLNLIYNYYDQQSGGVQGGPDFAINRLQLGLVVQY